MILLDLIGAFVAVVVIAWHVEIEMYVICVIAVVCAVALHCVLLTALRKRLARSRAAGGEG